MKWDTIKFTFLALIPGILITGFTVFICKELIRDKSPIYYPRISNWENYDVDRKLDFCQRFIDKNYPDSPYSSSNLALEGSLLVTECFSEKISELRKINQQYEFRSFFEMEGILRSCVESLKNRCIEGGCENGEGIMLDFSGKIKYEGGFKDGEKYGHGVLTHFDTFGEKYVGEFKDDKKNGQGTLTYLDTEYNGEFKDDKKNGYGTFTFAGKVEYEGYWKENKKNGKGTFTYADGDKYVGDYKDGERTGEGTIFWDNGDKQLKGKWENGELEFVGSSFYYTSSKDSIFETNSEITSEKNIIVCKKGIKKFEKRYKTKPH